MIEIYQDNSHPAILYVCLSEHEYYKFQPITGWKQGENHSGVYCLRHSSAKRITAKEAAEILGYIPKETKS